MQGNFLEQVLLDLQAKGKDLQECMFILPSKRSGTFLKKCLAEILGKNVFSPEVLSIEDFVVQLSGLTPVPNIDLLFLLYQAYRECDIKAHDDFDTFLKWGQTLLQDFNEIDRYLIPPEDILNYLSAIKEINHWSLKKDKTELVKSYLELWSHLSLLYTKFTKTLLRENQGYQGLIYRVASEKVGAISMESQNPIVFIGFNALNTAEANIIQHFLGRNGNLIYWDMDSYFLEDSIHDAGLFLRSYKTSWPYYQTHSLEGIHQNFLEPKNISIVGVPKSVSQAKYVGHLLEEIQTSSTGAIENAALVLADESLLNPVLQAIPATVPEVNITMGLPLNKTVIYTFFLSFLELHLAHTERGWYFEDVLKYFSNPFCQALSSAESENVLAQVSDDIQQRNRVYLDYDFLNNFAHSSELIKILFPNKEVSPSLWLNSCHLLIQELRFIFQEEKRTMELEYLYRFHTLFNQLHQQIKANPFFTDLSSLKAFYKQLAAMETLDFIGEPLSGLQIMGMLESRNLDFETVIITSVNEGILPSGKSNNSFFPFDVKRDYGLPTYKEKDAIYTYHFYRLIQRAKNVHLIYNTEPDVLEGGEKSRLISQLLTDSNISAHVSHNIATPELQIAPEKLMEIPKSESFLDAIRNYAGNGFSPTALTNYIRNPLDFYKKSILRTDEVAEVEETIAANTFGTLVHDSLEELYTPLINKILTTEQLKGLKLKIPKVVENKFMQHLPSVNLKKGNYLLVYNVISKYIQNFIDLELHELHNHEVQLLALEEKYTMELQVPGLNFPIKLKGTLDRVDMVDGTIRVVDYKTGRVNPGDVKLRNWESLISEYDQSKAFQLLFYAYLYSKIHGPQTLKAGIYSFKNMANGFLPFSSGRHLIDQDTLETFEKQLFQLIREICDPSQAFVEKKV
ncbi:PD-(D/E)XK nuclease family protein [Flagellimonas flava]|uniref:PD-(D/E)XK nuclease superfamily protein n=1 Tax=Flagellimonas flava TaxID=570519 RepID=A0A1M5KSE6_9FLAO|nr:PD-(D/E)XK nuclease family protein [Allomuricauda flava]SHG55688.1 PD-(D/E)XK nuclease superfamily protein [Allomuricauda flava]